jgi:rhodanese-related sulfurtransferase
MARKHPKKMYHKRKLTWLWVTLGAVLIALVGIVALSSQITPPAGISATQTVAALEISPAEAYAKFQQGAFFLDVRSQDEWNQFHIAGSTLIPLDQLPNRLGEVPKDKDVVVVCLSGHRSQSGTAIIIQAGFVHVSCLSGGLQAWMDANYPLERGTP